MKWARNVLGIVLVVAYASMQLGQTTSAQPLIVHGGSLTIQSKILETHYVIIDEQSRITEITSNTTEQARLRVFFQKVALGNERPLTEDIYQQYHAILPEGKATVGTVYKRSQVVRLPLFSNSTGGSKTDPLAFLKPETIQDQ